MTMACLRDMMVVKCSHYTTGRGWAPLHFNFTPHDFSFSKVETVVGSIFNNNNNNNGEIMFDT